MNDYVTYDLRSVASRLKNKDQYKNFVGRVEQVHAISSARRDLITAQSALQLLSDKFIEMDYGGEEAQHQQEALIGGALFCQAVVMYARATDTPGKARRPSGIRDKLPGEYLGLHKELMSLRNEALAHYSGGGDEWEREAVVLLLTSTTGKTLTPYSRLNYSAGAVIGYLELVKVAMDVSEGIYKRRVADLDAETQRLLKFDEGFRRVLRGFEFDPTLFFKTAAGVSGFDKHARSGGSIADLDSITKSESGRMWKDES